VYWRRLKPYSVIVRVIVTGDSCIIVHRKSLTTLFSVPVDPSHLEEEEEEEEEEGSIRRRQY
jgi:hypothetical protein